MKTHNFLSHLPRHRRRKAARGREFIAAEVRGLVVGLFVGVGLVVGIMLSLTFWGRYAN